MIDWETISGHQEWKHTHNGRGHRQEGEKIAPGIPGSEQLEEKINFLLSSLDRTVLIALRGEIFRAEIYIIM